MADNSTGSSPAVTEEIVLNLVTNFDQALRKSLAAYAGFQTKAGSISRSVEEETNSMYRQVTNNLSSMVANVQRDVGTSINFTRGAMRQNLDQANKLVNYLTTSMSKLTEFSQKARESIKPFMTEEEAEAALSKLSETLNNKLERIGNELYKRLGSLAKNVTETLVRDSEESLRALDQVSSNIITKLESIKNSLSAGGSKESLLIGKESIKEAEEQLKILEKSLREQRQRVIAGEKEMLIARTALNKQGNEKFQQANLEYYQTTVANLKKLNESYQQTERQVGVLANTIREAKKDFGTQAEAFKEKIKIKIDQTDLDSQFKAVTESFRKAVHSAAAGMDEEFQKNVRTTRLLEEAIKFNEKELRNLLETAKQLKAKGIIDTTQEITAINDLLSRIKTLGKEYTDFQKRSLKIDATKQVEDQFKQIEQLVSQFQNKIKTLYTSIDTSKISLFNVEKNKESLDQIIRLQEQFVKRKNALESQATKYEQEAQRIRIALISETDAKRKQQMEDYHRKLTESAQKIRKILDSVEIPDISKVQNKLKATADGMVKVINDSFSKIKPPTDAFKQIEKEYDAIKARLDKLAHTRFITKSSVNEVTQSIKSMRENVEAYRATIEKLKKDINELQRLQRKGFGDHSAQINEMKNTLSQYQSKLTQVNGYLSSSQQKMSGIITKSQKSVLRSGWEMIRDFRWQVAAVIYLVHRAINAVKKVFISTLDEIQKFRMSAMAIAASISYAMITPMSKSFKYAFDYAKDLMIGIEEQAAKTILTLEDMTMLVKTFTQAGLVPDTGDLEKIAAIGTAIKVLTEGMANAGVQMRQELYALIQGRQRVTDQVAKMLQILGINVEEMVEKAKKEGKSMIDAFSEALAPFAEMNKQMKDEYQVQINQLEIIWKRIKRIGGESVLMNFAQEIKKVTKSLAIFVDDTFVGLTEKGKNLAIGIKLGLETIVVLAKTIYNVFGSFFRLLGTIGSHFATFIDLIFGWNKNFNATLFIVKFILYGITTVGVALDGVLSLVDGIYKAFRAVLTTISWVLSKTGEYIGLIDEADKKWGDVSKSWKSAGSAFSDYYKRTEDSFNYINNALEQSNHLFDETDSAVDKVRDNLFGLPHDITKIAEKVGDLNREIQNTIKGTLEGPEKFKYELEISIGEKTDIAEYEKMLRENIEAFEITLERISMKSGTAFWENYTDAENSNLKRMQDSYESHKARLAEVLEYKAAKWKKYYKDLEDYREQERQKLARQKAEVESLMESLKPAPTNPFEKLEKDMNKLWIQIEKLYETNPEARKFFEEIFGLYIEKEAADFQKILDDVDQSIIAFEESLTSHRVLNPFQQITNEMEKQVIAARAMADKGWSPEMVENRLRLVETVKQERMELEKANMALEAQHAHWDAMALQADILLNAYTPAEKQMGQVLKLQVDFNRQMDVYQKKLDDINRLWKKNGEWIDTATDAIKAQELAIKTSMDNIAIIHEKHLEDVQRPFWKEMTDMSYNWYNQLADALTDLVLDFENFGDSITNVFRSIIREAMNAAIRMMVTNQMMNAFGGGGNAGWLGNLFTWGAGAAAGAAGNGIAATSTSAGMMSGINSITVPMAEGGIIKEPIIGQGLRSGSSYMFGEGGEDEFVIPEKKFKGFGQQSVSNTNVNLNINAIDTQTGVEFLMKNKNVIENQMASSLKNNKGIRTSIRRAF
jgi:hypothetical protein